MAENIKIVEMDLGESKGSLKSRNSYSSNHPQHEREEHRFSTHNAVQCAYSKQDNYQASPVPSALADMSPRASSGHFDEHESLNMFILLCFINVLKFFPLFVFKEN
jgi:hypothetical protein